MAKSKKGLSSGITAALDKVQAMVKENLISPAEIIDYAETDYPIFSFLYLSDHSWDKCSHPGLFQEFLMRLKKLSQLGWKKIGIADRHSFGFEKLPVTQLNQSARSKLPSFITDDMKLDVFRASGNNLPFLGLRKGRTFMVFLIEAKFGEVYDHR